jgi:S1-C subfamily serine protease
MKRLEDYQCGFTKALVIVLTGRHSGMDPSTDCTDGDDCAAAQRERGVGRSKAIITKIEFPRSVSPTLYRRAQFFILILAVMLAVPWLTNAREAASVHDIYVGARASVVLLIGFDANNQPLALGSGFFVKNDIIATNMHVIEGASSVKARYMSGEVSTITTIGGVDPDHDVVLLESPVHLSPLPLQLSSPDIGAPIVAIGNPRGLEGTVSTGIVSGIRSDKSDTYYQITAPISPGSSGGPVIDQDGKVIGISTFTLTQGQNLNFAVPTAYLDRLLASPRRISLAAVNKSLKPRPLYEGTRM